MFYTKPSQLFVLTFLAVILYICIVLGLQRTGVIGADSLAENLAQFFGWLVALGLAALHLTKSREDADEGRRLETKKVFQVEAFRGMNESLRHFSTTLTTIASPYTTISNTLFHFPVEIGEQRVKELLHVKVILNTSSLFDSCANFFTVYEANEIALMKFIHLKNYIGHEVGLVHKTIMEFQDFALDVPVAQFFEGEKRKEMARRCRGTAETIYILQAHLYDLRILLMNEFLGDVFEANVSRREPRDPKYSHLQDVANPELVEKIDREWYEKALSYAPPE